MNSVHRSSFRYALRRSVPILIGFFPVGTAYGIMMQAAGYNFLWSAAASLFVYAGSLQMLMITFFTGNLSFFSIAVTSLLLNSRHLFYGLSFLEKFEAYGPWKYFLIYGMPDESYSLLCSYKPIAGVEEKWVHIYSTALIWLYWIGFSVLGSLLGTLLPFDMTGVDFALTALFVVIFLDQMKSAPCKWPGPIAIACTIVWILILGPDNALLPALLTTVLLLTVFRPFFEAHTQEAPQ